MIDKQILAEQMGRSWPFSIQSAEWIGHAINQAHTPQLSDERMKSLVWAWIRCGFLVLSEEWDSRNSRTRKVCTITELALAQAEPVQRARPASNTCASCLYFEATDATCRIRSPGINGRGLAVWPRVPVAGWCGEGDFFGADE